VRTPGSCAAATAIGGSRSTPEVWQASRSPREERSFEPAQPRCPHATSSASTGVPIRSRPPPHRRPCNNPDPSTVAPADAGARGAPATPAAPDSPRAAPAPDEPRVGVRPKRRDRRAGLLDVAGPWGLDGQDVIRVGGTSALPRTDPLAVIGVGGGRGVVARRTRFGFRDCFTFPLSGCLTHDDAGRGKSVGASWSIHDDGRRGEG
jgi:hypothetical protein